MRDQFALGSLMEERFAWTVIPMPATQERILFDTACDKWDEYQRQQQLERNAHFRDPSQGGRHSQLFSEASSVISHLPAIPDISTVTNATFPSINLEDAHLSAPGTICAHCNKRSSGRGIPNRAHRSARVQSHMCLCNDAHPSQFLSRSMRVFVAWKA